MRTFSDHFTYLGCPLANIRWSWSAISDDGRRAIFTIWGDQVKGRLYVLYPPTERRPGKISTDADARLGAIEIKRIAEAVVADPSIEAFGVLSVAKDKNAVPRVRKTFDDRTLFRLRVERDGDRFVAHLVGRPEASMVLNAGGA
jgi:hypothetical protein